MDQHAVSYSRVWLQTILRDRLGFKGAVFSDDLNMEGANISSHYADRVSAAKEAGCDFALLCNNRVGVIQVLDQLDAAAHQVSEAKWSALQGNVSRVDGAYQKTQRWQQTQEFLLNKAW